MSRVIKYAALAVMLVATLAFAKKVKATAEPSSVQMSVVECPEDAQGEKCLKLCIVKTTDGETESKVMTIRNGEITECEGLEELADLCEGTTVVKVTVSRSEDDGKMIIMSSDGEIDCDKLFELKKLEDLESGMKICIMNATDEDGQFKAMILHDGEMQEFDDRESFDEYLKTHPELDIKIENCLPETPDMGEPIIEPEPGE